VRGSLSEEAIFLLKDYAITGSAVPKWFMTRPSFTNWAERWPKPIHKWDKNKCAIEGE